MATITLTAANNNWSTCNAGGPPAAGDVILLNNGATSVSLTLDLAAGSTYTCAAVRANTQADGLGSGTHGHIVTAETTPGPVLDFEMQAGTVELVTLASGKFIARAGKIGATAGIGGGGIVGGSASGAYGVNSTGTITTITNATGGSVSGAYGVVNNSGGTITTVTSATGGSVLGAYGVNNSSGTITTITNATGGSTSGAYGVNNSGGTITTITNATGGYNANPALAMYAFGVMNVNATSIPTVANVISGSCPGVGMNLRLPVGAIVGSGNPTGTSSQSFWMSRRRC